jgi:hypothetical protein
VGQHSKAALGCCTVEGADEAHRPETGHGRRGGVEVEAEHRSSGQRLNHFYVVGETKKLLYGDPSHSLSL